MPINSTAGGIGHAARFPGSDQYPTYPFSGIRRLSSSTLIKNIVALKNSCDLQLILYLVANRNYYRDDPRCFARLFALSRYDARRHFRRRIQYSANPAVPAPAAFITRDIVWNCGPAACQGATDESRPLVLCQSLAKRAGRVDSFIVDGHALTASELDTLQRFAKRRRPRRSPPSKTPPGPRSLPPRAPPSFRACKELRAPPS